MTVPSASTGISEKCWTGVVYHHNLVEKNVNASEKHIEKNVDTGINLAAKSVLFHEYEGAFSEQYIAQQIIVKRNVFSIFFCIWQNHGFKIRRNTAEFDAGTT